MQRLTVVGAALALGLLAAGCGSGGGDASTSASQSGAPAPDMASDTPSDMPSDTPPDMASAGAAAINSKKIDLGTILVDSKGMTLYLFEKDKKGKSACDGACATALPPLLTDGDPTPGPGVNASLLGTTTRSDGTTQVTYHGWPLYYYAADKAPGDITGQDVDSFGADWYVIGTEKGDKLEKES